jgi:Domain of unknown function (DUF6970)
MRRWTVTLLFALALSAACAPTGPSHSESLPPWLATLIDSLQRQPVSNPPAFVARYDYRAQVVYYLPPHCCDVWSSLYDTVGVIICHPDGGLSGSGDGLCPDFFQQRANERIVWRDARGAA